MGRVVFEGTGTGTDTVAGGLEESFVVVVTSSAPYTLWDVDDLEDRLSLLAEDFHQETVAFFVGQEARFVKRAGARSNVERRKGWTRDNTVRSSTP